MGAARHETEGKQKGLCQEKEKGKEDATHEKKEIIQRGNE